MADFYSVDYNTSQNVVDQNKYVEVTCTWSPKELEFTLYTTNPFYD